MNWLQVKNLNGENGARKAELWIDGVIGMKDWMDDSGVTAAEFIKTTNALGDLTDIDLFINTPGGVISDGVTITNYLINHKASVNVTVMGQAASIGSVIAQAADPGKLHMAIGTTMFVHDPLTVIMGDADDMRETADRLDKLRDGIVSIYQRRTDLSVAEIQQLLKDNTTMTAEDAVAWGFADTMDAELKAVACLDAQAALNDARNELIRIYKPPTGHKTTEVIDMSIKDKTPAGQLPEINALYLEKNHSELMASIRDEAVTNERQRVKGILATPLASLYPEEINAAIENGDSPDRCAAAILAKEGDTRSQTLTNHKDDAPKAVADPVIPDNGVNNSAPIEERCQAKWDKSESLRDEFGSFSTYLAFSKAEEAGGIKILGSKK